jgi:hypothetical protein
MTYSLPIIMGNFLAEPFFFGFIPEPFVARPLIYVRALFNLFNNSHPKAFIDQLLYAPVGLVDGYSTNRNVVGLIPAARVSEWNFEYWRY